MEIKDMINKVKISFEYSKKILGFGTITRGDLKHLDLMVFLKDGTKIPDDDIKEITFRIKRLGEDENVNI